MGVPTREWAELGVQVGVSTADAAAQAETAACAEISSGLCSEPAEVLGAHAGAAARECAELGVQVGVFHADAAAQADTAAHAVDDALPPEQKSAGEVLELGSSAAAAQRLPELQMTAVRADQMDSAAGDDDFATPRGARNHSSCLLPSDLSPEKVRTEFFSEDGAMIAEEDKVKDDSMENLRRCGEPPTLGADGVAQAVGSVVGLSSTPSVSFSLLSSSQCLGSDVGGGKDMVVDTSESRAEDAGAGVAVPQVPAAMQQSIPAELDEAHIVWTQGTTGKPKSLHARMAKMLANQIAGLLRRRRSAGEGPIVSQRSFLRVQKGFYGLSGRASCRRNVPSCHAAQVSTDR